jgi:hypothetical protein
MYELPYSPKRPILENDCSSLSSTEPTFLYWLPVVLASNHWHLIASSLFIAEAEYKREREKNTLVNGLHRQQLSDRDWGNCWETFDLVDKPVVEIFDDMICIF